MKHFRSPVDVFGDCEIIADIDRDYLGDYVATRLFVELRIEGRLCRLKPMSAKDHAHLANKVASEYELFKATRPRVEAIMNWKMEDYEFFCEYDLKPDEIAKLRKQRQSMTLGGAELAEQMHSPDTIWKWIKRWWRGDSFPRLPLLEKGSNQRYIVDLWNKETKKK